jgi:DNA helicase IV
MASAADGTLTRREQIRLSRKAARAISNETWTLPDLALLDELDALLNGPPRRYGHIVIDEAQDLSPMALRMIVRRSVDGRSVTILGDLAQATAPGCLRDWTAALDAFDSQDSTAIRELTIGYRVPAEIMTLANHLLATTAPQLPQTESVRSTGEAPRLLSATLSDLVAAAAREAAELLDKFLSIAVIAASRHDELRAELEAFGLTMAWPGRAHDLPHVSLLKPEEAKGLEFDAVIVIEPAEFLSTPGGSGLLYIALTRAVQHLTIIHSDLLPQALTPPER